MKNILLLSFIGVFLCASCINEEGKGGTGVVDGFVYTIAHPDGDFNFETDTFAAATTHVYIKYGNEEPYGDKMDAGPNGYFKFKYLTDGTYIVFAYSKYPDGRKEAVCDTVRLQKGKIATTKDIFIHEGKMFGKSYIKGRVWAFYYHGITEVDSRPAVENRVYIRKKGSPYHFDDVRCGAEGYFVFEKLPVGQYELYAVSENDDRITYVESVYEVTITQENQTVTMTEDIVIKLRS